MIGRADPDRVTMAWRIADRTGKIFIDHNMNRQGANIAAAYPLRPEPRAPVSTPLTWDEVEAGGFEPQDFRIDNVWERFAEVGDRWAPVREGPYNDLAPAMEALGVEPEEDPSGPLPRTASSAVAAKTSDEIALASKDPALFEYVRRREFGAEGTTEPAPGEDVGTGNVVRDPQAPGDAAALRRPARARRGAALVGGPEGPPDHQGRQTPGGPDRGPPARIREVRGHHPRGPLRSRRGAHLRRRLVRTGGVDRHEGLVPAPRPAVPEPRVPLRQDTDGLARVPRERADRPADRLAAVVPPMLAEGGHQAFDDDGWWFEPKLDGIRCLAELSTGETVLRSRTGRVVTDTYPELHMIHELIDEVNAVIDGEIVAVDADGKNSFEVLQQRMNLVNPREIDRARTRSPSRSWCSTCCGSTGATSRGCRSRSGASSSATSWRRTHGCTSRPTSSVKGSVMFEAAKAQQLEGVVAKRLGSPYVPGRRTDAWRKIKVRHTQDCVVLGFTPGQGGRGETFGALLLGAYVDGELQWVGQVGSGFTDALLAGVLEQLGGLVRDEPAVEELRSAKGAVFVDPKLVCEVTYLEMTKSTRKMRAPVFLRMREDKLPEDCVLERPISG